VLVLPHSGAGPGTYRPLFVDLPGDIEVLGLQLPGRERRIGEPPGAKLAEVLTSVDEIRRPGLPTLVLGHSLGALLAVRVARELAGDCVEVVASGQVPGDRHRWTDGLTTEADLLRVLELAGGTDPAALRHPAWRSVVLDTLRADLQLSAEAATDFGSVVIDAPITVLAGLSDPIIDPEVLPEWAAHTTGALHQHMLAGGHFALLADGNRAWSAGLLRQRLAAVPLPPTRLLCLPFAGAGAGFFHGWRRTVPSTVRVVGLQLPGRESRLREDPVVRVEDAVEAVMPAVSAELARPGRIGLFGHSMGAVLAFELARRVEATAPGRLSRLFVSGSPVPWASRHEFATGLPDDEFIARVQRFAGYQHVGLAEPALRELLLPVLRADVRLHESYRPADRRPVRTPITAIRGTDDELVSAEQAAGWSAATAGGFDLLEIPGRHMYLTERPAELLAAIERRLPAPGR
jgi:surfactin synthase thioesterase subunit